MTHPNAVENRQDGEAVEELQDGAAVEDRAGGEIAPQLAAIQQSYEEAMARIAGLARSPWAAAPDSTDAHPDTERIDVQLAKPPVVQEASTPETEAMSVAARCLAEQPILEEEHRPADPSVIADRPRRWWQVSRIAAPAAVLVPR